MAGTIPLSMTQQFDANGKVLAGGKLYIIQAGTTNTSQTAYSDGALTLALSNPITLDASGRIPQFFLADGSIKIRLTNAAGVTQVVADGLLVVGASSGGGGGSPVDATTVLQTGDLKARYGTGVHTGFVRANGRTIGSASSGASERANADCVSLFEFLWDNDANLSVSTGRGANSAADWAANKTIVLPDWRGRALAFLDDMGNSAAGRLTASYFGATATTLGAAGGDEKETLATSQIPTITSRNATQSVTVTAGGTLPISNAAWGPNSTGTGPNSGPNSAGTIANQAAAITGTNDITVTSNNTGGASPTPVITVQPTMLATFYIKL